MRILFLGDVVGRSGRDAIAKRLPEIIQNHGIDFVVVNAENSAGGFGVTESVCTILLNAGVDVLTGGNHSWSNKEAFAFIDRESRLLRPLNDSLDKPGRGAAIFEARNGAQVLVINVMGRVFMDQSVSDPFAEVKMTLAAFPLKKAVDAIIIDFHAEATSEKQAMAHFVDGKATLVAGTHTHVPTADHRILERGTGAITDVGMCGDYDSIIGMERDDALSRFLKRGVTSHFRAARGEGTLSGVMVDVDERTGLAAKVAPFRVGGRLQESVPPETMRCKGG